MPPSRNEFEDKFPVMFDFYRSWAKLTKDQVKLVEQLAEHWSERGVHWKDGRKDVDIPRWAAVRTVLLSEGDILKAKRLCMSLNHPSGYGCLPQQKAKTCTHIHKCLFCGVADHGMYETKANGDYRCPKHGKFQKEREDYCHAFGDPDEHEEHLIDLGRRLRSAGAAKAKAVAAKAAGPPPKSGFAALIDEEASDSKGTKRDKDGTGTARSKAPWAKANLETDTAENTEDVESQYGETGSSVRGGVRGTGDGLNGGRVEGQAESNDGTGSTTSFVQQRTQQPAVSPDVLFRVKMKLKFSQEFKSSEELYRFLEDNGHLDELREYEVITSELQGRLERRRTPPGLPAPPAPPNACKAPPVRPNSEDFNFPPPVPTSKAPPPPISVGAPVGSAQPPWLYTRLPAKAPPKSAGTEQPFPHTATDSTGLMKSPPIMKAPPAPVFSPNARGNSQTVDASVTVKAPPFQPDLTTCDRPAAVEVPDGSVSPFVSGTGGVDSPSHQDVITARLEEVVPGMSRVLDQAKIFQLPAGSEYAEKILAWITANEAVDGREVLESIEEIAEFTGIKPLPMKRLQKALEMQFTPS